MRVNSPVVPFLLVALLGLGVGCRRPSSPVVDTSQAPETWITAAAMDTLTLEGQNGAASTGLPSTAKIPVRFHLYWAGSSKDGTIAGYYWALVETTGEPAAGGAFPTAPAPRPQDYRFTTRSDSTFVIDLSGQSATRPCALYLYALDKSGRADPTPARFDFLARTTSSSHRPWVLDAEAIGTIVTLNRDFSPVVHPDQVFLLTHEFVSGEAPRDTVPVHSRLEFQWRREPKVPGTGVVGHVEGAEETGSGDSESTLLSPFDKIALPDSQDLSPGPKVITIQVPRRAGGGTTTRYFMVNFSPDTWWAGPDPRRWPISTDGEGARAVDVSNWNTFTTAPAWPPDGRGYFGPDSFRFLPSKRRPPGGDFKRRTFYEIYKDRIYARSEGDTVHMNSWVVLYNGGYDKDSKYVPRVDPADPALPPGFASDPVRYAVLANLGLAGSPIGFRSIIPMKLTPAGIRSSPSLSALYPAFEPASVFRAPFLGGYWRMFRAGKAYALARAEDSDGARDDQITDPIALADHVDGGGGTPAERLERRKIITFYVDKAPALVTNAPSFRPSPRPVPNNPAVLDTFPDVPNSCTWNFHLIGHDLDPIDPTLVNPPPGGPTSDVAIRFKVTLYGKNLAGRDTSWTYIQTGGTPYLEDGASVMFNFSPGGTSGNPFATGDMYASIQICDCFLCESQPGQGRCVTGRDPAQGEGVSPNNYIHFYFKRPAACP